MKGIIKFSVLFLGGTLWALTIVYLLFWNFFWAAVMVAVNKMNDFGKFYFSARNFIQGVSLYGPTVATSFQVPENKTLILHNLNPPHFHLLLFPFALLSQEWALGGWAILNFACLLLSLILILKELEIQLTFLQGWGVFTGLLAFSPMTMIVSTGQWSLILMLIMTLAWRDFRNNSFLRGGIFLGVCIGLKLFLLVFVPYLLMRKNWRAALGVSVAIACSLIVGMVVFGYSSYKEWLGILLTVDWAWLPMNASATGLIARLFVPNDFFANVVVASDAVVSGISLTLSITIGVVTFALLRSTKEDSNADRDFAILLLGAILMSPLGWGYYLWLLVGPVAALIKAQIIWKSGLTRRRRGFLFEAALRTCAGVGLFLPCTFADLHQPNPWMTGTIGSAYFWSVLSIWLLCLASKAGSSSRVGAAAQA